MDIDTLIDMLKDYCKDSNKSDNKEIFNSYQQQYLNGYAGVIINSIDDKFEIYTYIKNKDKITSPLLLWKTDSEEKANNYYNRLVEIIKSQDYNVLIGFCKSGLYLVHGKSTQKVRKRYGKSTKKEYCFFISIW